MKAKEKAPDFVPRRVNLIATNIRLPAGKEHLEAFLRKHPEDAPLKPALLAIFEGLAHADELGSLLQIEEPVEKELRALKAKYEAAGSPMEQQALWRQFQKPVQGKLPIGVATYEQWKQDVLARLREHFDAEARDVDLGTAFFGEAAGKGLTLVDLLARRYEVVAANPPYMGSKNMGSILKGFIERHFAAGKRDLYAAFILRCLQLAGDGGRVSMVTQQSWMFLRSFADLRALDDEKRKKTPRAFGGLLRETMLEELAHLGPRAFREIGGEVVNSALFVVARTEPTPAQRLTAFRLVGPKSPDEKDALLRDAIGSLGQGETHPVISRPLQARFLSIPQTPLCYWLRERFFELLAGRKELGQFSTVARQVITSDNPRFVRAAWEAPRHARWVPYVKGGGYAKWAGFERWSLDWMEAARLKNAVLEKFPYLNGNWSWLIKVETMDRKGWTMTRMARQGLCVREISGVERCDNSSPVIVPHQPLPGLGAVLNWRSSTYLIRSLSTSLTPNESYVARLPVPEEIPNSAAAVEATCIVLKRSLVALDPTERSFAELKGHGGSFTEAWRRISEKRDAVAAVLHALEGHSERIGFVSYGIAGDDLQAVLDETGTPAGWFPLISGRDAIPELPSGLSLPAEVLESASRDERRYLSTEALADLKARLSAAYEAGPGGELDGGDEALAGSDISDEEDDEGEATVSGARIPIPAETFLEELSQKLEIHPISVYWLLRALREEKGVISKPELVRFVEDYLSVTVLRLLGHQWPREVEGQEPVPAWADRDGIIPLTDGTSETALIARVRSLLAEDFGADRAGAAEREFQEITGKPLAAWLASDFFRRHISQFKKRPIAWQLASTAASNGKRRGRGATQTAPAFACLLYYHRLDADLLPKLRTQYIGPLRTSLQTELGALEKMPKRSADQDSRRLELEGKLDELKAFDARIDQVIAEGFASPALDRIATKEPLDKWVSDDGKARAPESRDAFLAQERRYDPDLNDGVRVNIAPLQRAGLLAADVLAAKDVEKAITDRAEWRADERRWCRDGKLPQPGWWPTDKGA